MSEGKVDAAERKGASGQVWLLRPFTERTVLEMGFGAYAMRDQLTWSRVITDYERDSDVFMLGAGVAFRASGGQLRCRRAGPPSAA